MREACFYLPVMTGYKQINQIGYYYLQGAQVFCSHVCGEFTSATTESYNGRATDSCVAAGRTWLLLLIGLPVT